MVRAQIGPGPGKYKLPPVVGYKDHDSSRYRYPQYSCGIQLGSLKKYLGPGPKYHIENMTPYGRARPPAYSLVSKKKELTTFRGPGPAAYDITKVPRMAEARPPAYSMADRHGLRPNLITPAPNNYQLPSTIGPKVPDKNALPAYSMSAKHILEPKQASPGPARYDPTTPNAYKNKLPQYSMSIRHKDLTKHIGPGPMGYHPQLDHSGGYSFGLRTDNAPYITPDDEMPCLNK